jgi:hypothetical protein
MSELTLAPDWQVNDFPQSDISRYTVGSLALMLQNDPAFAEMHAAVDLPGTLNRYTHEAAAVIARDKFGHDRERIRASLFGVAVFEMLCGFVRPNSVDPTELQKLEAARAELAAKKTEMRVRTQVALPQETDTMVGDTPNLDELMSETLEHYIGPRCVALAMGNAAYAQLIRIQSDKLLAEFNAAQN